MKADFIPSTASWAAAAATRQDPSAAHVYSPCATRCRASPPALAPSLASPSPPLLSGDKERAAVASLEAIAKVCALGRRSGSSPWSHGGAEVGCESSFPSPRCPGRVEGYEGSRAVPWSLSSDPPLPSRDGGTHGHSDGLARSETSTWLVARAGSGDTASAPPLTRCPCCLRAQRYPNCSMPPSRVICCRFLLTMWSLSHPGRCEGTVLKDGKQVLLPTAQDRGGRGWESRRRYCTGQGCWQDPRVLGTIQTTLFAPYTLTVHVENPKCDRCNRTWCLPPHSVGRRTNCFLSG